MTDVDALLETLAEVRRAAETGHWDQRQWGVKTEGCGTAFCFAGWRLSLDGARLEGANTFRLPNDEVLFGPQIYAWGALRFGITTDEVIGLFDSDNSLEDLELHVKRLVEAA